MVDIKQVYESFVQNAVRLSKSLDFLQLLATDYIFKELPTKTIAKILKNNPDLPTPFFDENVLKDGEVLFQTIKMVTLMEASDTLKDFKTLHKKRKGREVKPVSTEEGLEGFAKILEAMAGVPKPTKEDLKKFKEKEGK